MLVCGFLIHIVLARQLGPERFGVYALVISVLLWVESAVAVGIPSVYRKIISEDGDLLKPIVRSMRRTSMPYCLIVGVIFALASPFIASALGDRSLQGLLIIASLDIPFLGMYATYLAVLNGNGEFFLQSSLAAFYSAFRTVLIVGAVWFGFEVVGALVGNALGSLVGMVVAWYFTAKLVSNIPATGRTESEIDGALIRSRMMSFGMPYLFSALLTSVLVTMDIWFVKALSDSLANGDESVGYYGAAVNLARVPYLLMTAISVSIFPAISKAVFDGRNSDAKDLIQNLLRLQMLLLLPAVVAVGLTGEEIVALLYSDAYRPAGDSLKILFFGVSAFTTFSFFTNIIAAENKPYFGVVVSLILVPVAGALNVLAIPKYGIVGAALATTLVSVVGMAVAAVHLSRRYGQFLNLKSLARISIAAAGMAAMWQWDWLRQTNILFAYVVLGAVYLFGLLFVGEVSRKEIGQVVDAILSNKGRNTSRPH